MNYYIKENEICLSELKKRIMETDLVPSRTSIRENIDEIFLVLENQGIDTLADLRMELKSPAKVKSLSEKSKINENYLTLLRREINSYFPKRYLINELTWLDKAECEKLKNAKLENTQSIYETLIEKEKFSYIQKKQNIDKTFLLELLNLVDLMRIQWTSPLAARMFYEAGYKNSKAISEADPNELCDSVNKVNEDKKYFKGKIGLRDFKRMIHSSKYVI